MTGTICIAMLEDPPYNIIVAATDDEPEDWCAELPLDSHLLCFESFKNSKGLIKQFIQSLNENGIEAKMGKAFPAAPYEVLRVFIEIRDQALKDNQVVKNSDADDEDDENAEFFSSEPDDKLDEFVLEDEEPDYPWLALWEMAGNYYSSSDGGEAMKLYKQAIKLGCLPAYTRIGRMYYYGLGVTENHKKALEWFKEGVKKGAYDCYEELAGMFWRNKKIEDFHKAYRLLFRDRKNKRNAIIEDFSYIQNNEDYVVTCYIWSIEPRREIAREGIFDTTKDEILVRFRNCLAKYENNDDYINNNSIAIAYRLAIDWVEENL